MDEQEDEQNKKIAKVTNFPIINWLWPFFYFILHLQSQSDSWGRVVLDYETDITDNLPFEDFSVGDLGADNQEFGLDMGKVCFAWG